MSIVGTDTEAAERSLPGQSNDALPLALAAVARFGTAGAAILGGLLLIALALFGF